MSTKWSTFIFWVIMNHFDSLWVVMGNLVHYGSLWVILADSVF